MRNLVWFHFVFGRQNWSRNMLQLLCLLNHVLVKIRRTELFLNVLTSMFVSALVTGLTGKPAGRLGHVSSRGANRFCEVCLTTEHGSTYTPFRSKIRFLRFDIFYERTILIFRRCSTIRLPAATSLHAATRGLCNFVHDTELQILHVTILKFECGNLESKLPIFSPFAAMYS